MSDSDSLSDSMAEQWASTARFWTDMFSKMAAASFEKPFNPPPEAARQIRDAMFSVMAEYMDSYLRSPQFLEMTKSSMDAALAMRKQLNDTLTSTQHEMQGTAIEDVDTLLRSVRHLETRILDRLEEVDLRLDDISRTLNALKKRGAAAKPESGA